MTNKTLLMVGGAVAVILAVLLLFRGGPPPPPEPPKPVTSVAMVPPPVAGETDVVRVGVFGQPMTPDGGTGGGEYVVKGEFQPSIVGVSNDAIYWGDFATGQMKRVGKDGGAPTVLSQHTPPVGLLSFSEREVFFTLPAEGKVMASAKDKWAPRTLVSGLVWPLGVAVSGDEVFFVEAADIYERKDGRVGKVSVDGGAVTNLDTTTRAPAYVAVGGDWVFFNSGRTGVVKKVKKTGGPSEIVAENQLVPGEVVTDATHVYWANQGTTPPGEANAMRFVRDGNVVKVPINGGPVQLLAKELARPWPIALSRERVFVSTGDAKIFSMKKDGTDFKQVVELSAWPGGSISADDQHVYLVSPFFKWIARWPH